MHIFLGVDHRGFELKNRILDWLKDHSIPCTDFGAYNYDAEDDYNDYAKQVAHAILEKQEPQILMYSVKSYVSWEQKIIE